MVQDKPFFFWKGGANPSLCIRMMHTDFIAFIENSINGLTIQGSQRVETWINQRKIQNNMKRLCINMLSYLHIASRTGWRTPVRPCPNSCTNIRGLPLVLSLEKGPRTDPVHGQRNNLHERNIFGFIKNIIVSNMPYSPKQSTHSHSYLGFVTLAHTVQPISKQI